MRSELSYEYEKMADGVFLVGRHSFFEVGAWVLESGGECAVMEMPLPTEGKASPALQVRQFITDMGWKCRYLLLSHPHLDHVASIDEYVSVFPEAQFPVHFSVPLSLRIAEKYWSESNAKDLPSDFDNEVWKRIKKGRGSQWYISFFTEMLSEDLTKLPLGEDFIYMIYGPKHSLGDIHHFFKGVWFSGDWWIGRGEPCVDRASFSKGADSVSLIEKFVKDEKYKVHSIFPAHANNILRDIDLNSILEETKKYHQDYEEANPDELDWKNFCIRTFYYFSFRNEFMSLQP